MWLKLKNGGNAGPEYSKVEFETRPSGFEDIVGVTVTDNKNDRIDIRFTAEQVMRLRTWLAKVQGETALTKPSLIEEG